MTHFIPRAYTETALAKMAVEGGGGGGGRKKKVNGQDDVSKHGA